MFDLIIIGGGIAGLSAAFYAQKQKANFVLLEASDQLGGVISTKELEENCIAENGPNSLVPGPTIKEIIQDLNFKLLPARRQAKKKLIYLHNRFYAVPQDLWKILSLKTFWCILKEPFSIRPANKPEESVAEFFKRHFNQEIVDNLLWPILSGIYAGNPEKLSLQSVFPQLVQIEQKHKSLLLGFLKEKSKVKLKREIYSTEKGLKAFIQSIKNFISPEKIILNSTVNSLKPIENIFEIKLQNGQNLRAKKVILAIPAYKAAELWPEVLGKLQEIYYAPIITLTVWLKPIIGFENAFGFLSARSQNTKLLGVIFNSSLFSRRCPNGQTALTLFLGGINNPDLINYSIEDLKSLAFAELQKAFQLNPQSEMQFKTCKIWPQGIPQYNLGHQALIEEVLLQIPKNLQLAGNYLKGVSLEDTANSGKLAFFNLNPRKLPEK